jgi:TonB-linked SusC/RagA family outer membrane protein
MQKALLRICFLLVMVLACTWLYAQERVVTGVITNEETKEPLPGVTVSVKGTNRSTITNEKGLFSIAVSGNESVLKISSVGFKYQEVIVGNRTSLALPLLKDARQLDDVVIVGYGSQRKAHLTGAVETIKGTEIEDLPVSNLGTAIQGRVLGLAVSGGITRPGSTPSLTIRNPMSLAKDGGNNEPLYVIDGIIQVNAQGRPDNTWFNNLDASEVESITILKDAAAAVYGSRGANGVVLVTTKRGKSGAPRISYSGSYGWNDEEYRTKMLSAYDFARYMNIMNGPNGANRPAGVNNFFTPDEMDHFKNINHDWLAPAWRSAYNTRHALNVSGGSDKATYFANASYYAQNGNLSSLDFSRWTFRSGADVRVAANMKVGMQIAGNYGKKVKTFNKIGGENDENDYRNLLLAPRYVPMYVNGYPVRLPGTDQLSQYHFYEIERLGNLATDKDKAMMINLYAEYDLPFIQGLKARASYARNFSGGTGSQVGTTYELYEFNRTGANQHIYDDATIFRSSRFQNGNRLYYSNSNAESYQFNFVMNYARTFGKHNVSGLFSMERAEASNEQQDVWREQPIANTNGQFNTAFGVIDGRTSANESGALGYIGRANYSYSDKYLAEFLFRTDASTKFAPENYWGRFYSASFGWVISNENFFNIPAVNFLKLRYSTGLLGKDDTRPWQWRQRYTFQNNGGAFGGNPSTGMSPGMRMEVAPNRNATWSDEYKNNLGVDARFLRSRLSLTLEGFYNKGRNMLIERTESVPVTVGGSIASENYAAIDFYGYEVSLGWNDRIGKDFNYGITAMFSSYNNKVLLDNFSPTAAMYPWVRQAGQPRDIGVWGYDYLGMFRTQAEVDAYVQKYGIQQVFGVQARDLKPGMLYYSDVRGPLQADGKFAGPDGIIDVNDQIQLAKRSSSPYGYALNLKANYKGFGFDCVITGSFGGWSEIDGASRKKMNNDISRNFQSRPAFWADIYDPELNPEGRYPNPHWEDVNLNPTSEFWRVSAFRMRMRNLNVNYTLPKKIAESLRLSNARFVLSALNPIDFANPFSYKASEGAFDTFPNLRTYSVGVNLSF